MPAHFSRLSITARSRKMFIIVPLAQNTTAGGTSEVISLHSFYRNGTKAKRGQTTYPMSNSHLAAEQGLHPSLSNPSQQLLALGDSAPMGHLKCLETFLVVTGGEGRVLQAAGGQKLGMLLNILHAQGSSPQQRITQPSMKSHVNTAGTEKSQPKPSQSSIDHARQHLITCGLIGIQKAYWHMQVYVCHICVGDIHVYDIYTSWFHPAVKRRLKSLIL